MYQKPINPIQHPKEPIVKQTINAISPLVKPVLTEASFPSPGKIVPARLYSSVLRCMQSNRFTSTIGAEDEVAFICIDASFSNFKISDEIVFFIAEVDVLAIAMTPIAT